MGFWKQVKRLISGVVIFSLGCLIIGYLPVLNSVMLLLAVNVVYFWVTKPKVSTVKLIENSNLQDLLMPDPLDEFRPEDESASYDPVRNIMDESFSDMEDRSRSLLDPDTQS